MDCRFAEYLKGGSKMKKSCVPNYKGQRFDNAVKKHEIPNNQFHEYEYVKRKVCGNNLR